MEQFIACNGIPVHISDSHERKKCVILLHGYLETMYIWDDFLPYLSDYRIISMDIPGHGLTGSCKDINSMGFCADIVRCVLDRLQIKEKVTLIGHSMGGYIAIESAKRFPWLFSSLVLMHSTPFSDSVDKKLDRKREISLIMQNKLQQIVKLSVPKMFSPANARVMEDKIFEIIELAEIHDPEGIIAAIEGIGSREDNCAFLASTTLPVLIFYGMHDNYISTEKAEEMCKIFPDAHHCFLQNSGHTGFLEEPGEVAARLLTFLASLP